MAQINISGDMGPDEGPRSSALHRESRGDEASSNLRSYDLVQRKDEALWETFLCSRAINACNSEPTAAAAMNIRLNKKLGPQRKTKYPQQKSQKTD